MLRREGFSDSGGGAFRQRRASSEYAARHSDTAKLPNDFRAGTNAEHVGKCLETIEIRGVWKAAALPLSYTRIHYTEHRGRIHAAVTFRPL